MRVLLVDDDGVARECLAAELTFDGHKVVVAASSHVALHRFCEALEAATPFNAVVADHGIGIEMADSVRALSRSVRIILLTSREVPARDAGHFPDSVNILIDKPVRIVELRAALQVVSRA